MSSPVRSIWFSAGQLHLRPQPRYFKQGLTLLVVGGFVGPAKALLGVALALVYRRHVGSRDAIVAPPRALTIRSAVRCKGF